MFFLEISSWILRLVEVDPQDVDRALGTDGNRRGKNILPSRKKFRDPLFCGLNEGYSRKLQCFVRSREEILAVWGRVLGEAI